VNKLCTNYFSTSKFKFCERWVNSRWGM